MWLESRVAQDVRDGLAARDERVGDELAMTAPRYSLRAQHRGRPRPSDVEEPGQRSLERLRPHVVGVSAERGASPRRVHRIRPGDAAATEVGGVLVPHTSVREGGGQGLAPELWVAPGAGIPPDVHHVVDAVDTEQHEELIQG